MNAGFLAEDLMNDILLTMALAFSVGMTVARIKLHSTTVIARCGGDDFDPHPYSHRAERCNFPPVVSEMELASGRAAIKKEPK